jgi:hypothetical protein
MLKNLLNREDNDYEKDDNELEELYERLYKKIARDFVHKDDLRQSLSHTLNLYEALGIKLDETTASLFFDEAINQAIEYKENLSKPRNKRKKYKDVGQ